MNLTNRQVSKLITPYIISNFPNSSVDMQKIVNAVLSESKYAVLPKCGSKNGKKVDLLIFLWGEGAHYHTL